MRWEKESSRRRLEVFSDVPKLKCGAKNPLGGLKEAMVQMTYTDALGGGVSRDLNSGLMSLFIVNLTDNSPL